MKKFGIIAIIAALQIGFMSAVPKRHDAKKCRKDPITGQKICYTYNSSLYQRCINSADAPGDDKTDKCTGETIGELRCQKKYFKLQK